MNAEDEARVRAIILEEFNRRESEAMAELIKAIDARANERGQM